MSTSEYSSLFDGVYRERRVLVTGHTGFKGSWLVHWLDRMGAHVSGLALPGADLSHWRQLGLTIDETLVDIADLAAVRRHVEAARPEIVFHLAAQPLVRLSYREPVNTWQTNVLGTVNLLEACRESKSVRAVVAITTDKVYANNEWAWGYREIDRLGGYDPYSASKAAAELAVASYRSAFLAECDIPLASARAGNVIGGGDWSEDRLIPDLARAMAGGRSLEIRSPRATRPWQHVLETLSGYLLLGQKLIDQGAAFAEAWNFGPSQSDNRAVDDVLSAMKAHWPEMVWEAVGASKVHEAGFLFLDSSKARSRLGWSPVWNLDRALAKTAAWYRDFAETGSVATATQLADYIEDAGSTGAVWTG